MAAVAKLLTVSAVACCRRRRPVFSSLRAGPSLRLNSTATVPAAGRSITHDEAVPPSSSLHPWPEWERFIEALRGKGYFVLPPGLTGADVVEDGSFGEDGNGRARGGVSDDDLNKVKNACLKFGRERFDILRSLPKKDIQFIVECGCPTLFRKAVNSAKRLRAYLQLDESKVCSACKLRDSCDRADKAATDDNEARTVDVMRILLTYAIEPANLLGEHAVTGEVQESARKLLSNLIDLSDTSIDPSLSKPELHSKKGPKVTTERSGQSIGKMKRTHKVEATKGDWLCPNCNFLNFARNIQCRECKTDGPKLVDHGNAEMKLGDWTCPSCQFMNFARNKTCFRCEEVRPRRELNPGEWECPSCSYINFRRNKVCKRCNHEHPVDEDISFQDHEWRKPTISTDVNSLLLEDKDGGVASSTLGTNQICSKKLKQFGDDQSDGKDESQLGAHDRGGLNWKQFEKDKNLSLGSSKDDGESYVISPVERKNKIIAGNRGNMLSEVKPRRALNPGEWECPSCYYLNFRQNKSCRQCKHARPERGAGPYTNLKGARRLTTEKSFPIGGDETDDNFLSEEHEHPLIRSRDGKSRQFDDGSRPSTRGNKSILPLVGESEFLLKNRRKKQNHSVNASKFNLEDSEDEDSLLYEKRKKDTRRDSKSQTVQLS